MIKIMDKKLLLINPVPKNDINIGRAVPMLRVPPLGLGYLAALTPPGWEIRIIDENVEEYHFQEADLVGLTSMTYNSPRAYELATEFKKRKIPTVIGGIHASTLPEEALRFVDSVIIGEAENVWPKLIEDFRNNKLRKIYTGVSVSLENLVRPRRDLFSNKYLFKGVVQTARGCPMNCDFCSVTAFSGGLYRQRPVEDVLDEIESLDSKFIFFLDDNILGYGKIAEQRAIQLFKGIAERKLNIRWGSQTSINFADNEEVLKWARKSGCYVLFIGFESINEKALQNMHKIRNLKEGVSRYKNIVRKFHEYGIGVAGSFIFGNDDDEKDIFKRTADFVLESKMDASQASVLTPLPGTKLYKKLKEEGRILFTNYPHDWSYYDVSNIVFKPKNMTPQELREGIWEFYKRTTSVSASLRRSFNSLLETKNLPLSVFTYLWNRGYGSIFFKKYGNK